MFVLGAIGCVIDALNVTTDPGPVPGFLFLLHQVIEDEFLVSRATRLDAAFRLIRQHVGTGPLRG